MLLFVWDWLFWFFCSWLLGQSPVKNELCHWNVLRIKTLTFWVMKWLTASLNTVTLNHCLFDLSAQQYWKEMVVQSVLFFIACLHTSLCKGLSDCKKGFYMRSSQFWPRGVWTFHQVLQGLNVGAPCSEAWKTSGNPRTIYSLLEMEEETKHHWG